MAQKTAESKSGLASSDPNNPYGSHCAKCKAGFREESLGAREQTPSRKPDRAARLPGVLLKLLEQHLKAGSHAVREMARHVAVEKPDTRIIGNHVGDHTHHGREHDHVCTHVAHDSGLTMPMAGVNVMGFFVVWICEDVPADMFSLTHGHYRAVPVEIAVDGVKVMEVVDVNVASVIILPVAIESF